MYPYDPASQTFLAAAPDGRVDLAVWITARNRATGAAETLGLWSGDDHATLSIDGEVRTYLGAGELLDAAALIYEPGAEVRRWRVQFSGASPALRAAWQTYDAHKAPVVAHQILRRARTHALVGTPRRLIEGEIEDIDAGRPAQGEAHVVTVIVASKQRRMHIPLPALKSDAQQSLRLLPGGAPDRLRRHAGATGLKPVQWMR